MSVEFIEGGADLNVMQDDELVGFFVINDELTGKQGFSSDEFCGTDYLTGNDLIAIGEKLNELNGVKND